MKKEKVFMKESDYYKIIVAVPIEDASKIREVMNKAGASRQGNYDFASGSYKAMGRWRPLEGSSPAIGTIGKIEELEEEVIMTLCHRDKLESVVKAIKKAHPYEEPAIDIIKRYEVD